MISHIFLLVGIGLFEKMMAAGLTFSNDRKDFPKPGLSWRKAFRHLSGSFRSFANEYETERLELSCYVVALGSSNDAVDLQHNLYDVIRFVNTRLKLPIFRFSIHLRRSGKSPLSVVGKAFLQEEPGLGKSFAVIAERWAGCHHFSKRPISQAEKCWDSQSCRLWKLAIDDGEATWSVRVSCSTKVQAFLDAVLCRINPLRFTHWPLDHNYRAYQHSTNSNSQGDIVKPFASLWWGKIVYLYENANGFCLVMFSAHTSNCKSGSVFGCNP